MKKSWRKDEKSLYFPKTEPMVINPAEMEFISLRLTRNPNSEEFSKKIEALYSFSYKLRMSYKWDKPPAEYYMYTVYHLEGVWDFADKSKYRKGFLGKDNLSYRIMIRQPRFINTDLFNDSPELISISEGSCIQMMHIGPYATENESFAIMERFAEENGYVRIVRKHREIYKQSKEK